MKNDFVINYVSFLKRLTDNFMPILVPIYLGVSFVLFNGNYSLNLISIMLYIVVIGVPTLSYVRFCKFYLGDIQITTDNYFRANLYLFDKKDKELCFLLHDLRFVVQKVWWAAGNSYELVIYHKRDIVVTQREYGDWNKKKFDELLTEIQLRGNNKISNMKN